MTLSSLSRVSLLFVFFAGLVSAFSSNAQGADVSSSAKAKAETSAASDYSEEFNRLVAPGFPNFKNARWKHDKNAGISGGYRSRFGEIFDSPTIYRIFQTRFLLLTDFPGKIQVINPSDFKLKTLPNESMGIALKQPDADLKSDAAVILRDIKKISNRSSDSDIVKETVQVFIFSAYLHQRGNITLANQLAAELFRCYPDKKKQIVAGAVSLLARDSYNQATDAVLESGDWKEYAIRLENLLRNTPEEWWSRHNVQRLLTAVQKRANGVKNPLKMPPGHAPDTQTVAALEALLQIKRNTYQEYPRHQEILWVLPKAAVPRKLGMNGNRFFGAVNYGRYRDGGTSGIDAIPEEIFNSLTISRMAAIPTLIAATADNTPICLPQGSSEYAWADSNIVMRKTSEDEFSSIYRPATRAEIASGILRVLLPANSAIFALPRDVGAEAMRFWETHKNDTDEQLASFFLKETKQENYLAHIRNRDALNYLSRSGASGMSALFEEHVLASNNPEELLVSVENYLVLRRAAAAPFAQKFIALLKARKDDPQFKRPDPKTSPTRSKGQFLYSQNELELHIQKLEQLADSL